jgi:hypothetical protein
VGSVSILAIFSIIYILIGMAIIRPVAGHLAWSWHYAQITHYSILYRGKIKPSSDQWTGATVLAVLAGAVWPMILFAGLSGKILPSIGAEKQAQLEAEIKARKERDKDLGLEPYEYGRIG